MEKKNCKILVLIVVVLFLGAGVAPLIGASTVNNYKENLSESDLQNLPPSEANFYIICIGKFLNETSGYIEITIYFGFYTNTDFTSKGLIKKGNYKITDFYGSMYYFIIYGRCSTFELIP